VANLVQIRYNISNNDSALNVMEICLFRLSNWENPTVDIIPLFESVDDLQNAHEMMEVIF
jgi:phosphoenolpyruvate carboxylase